ncbi:hypothetical protein BZG36_04338 [Bifiguratus adelaidae]|uniref:UBX domain-containing protein n=1 Tax=Bifiguratus adelaidae TaxID=1938954 RepID=A0A261XW05_9FUNG|nr:hypothetical protein BZG36_04338 [Bifiguratus adelaidae]
MTDTVAPTSTDTATSTPERNLQIYGPHPSGRGPAGADLPDTFFKPSGQELKAALDAQTKARMALENTPLKTQAIRDAEEKEKMNRNPKARIRVKLPDGYSLQAEFASSEPTSELFEYIRSLLRTPDRSFSLLLPPRTKLAADKVTLFKNNLAPSASLMLTWNDKTGDAKAPVLADAYVSKAIMPPSSPNYDIANEAPKPKERKEKGKAEDKKDKKLPKWLQKGLLRK